MDGYVETEQPSVAKHEALTSRVGIKALVAAFQEAEATTRAAFAAIVQAEYRVNAVFSLGEDRAIRIDASYTGGNDNFADIDEAIERMRRAAWRCLVDRLEIRRVMGIESWNRLEKELERGEVQPITEETVASLVQRYASDLPAIFREKVAEVFDWIRPRLDTPRAEYKTNQKNAVLEIGPKIILTGVISRSWHGSGFQVSHYSQQRIAALESVFTALDGQGWGTKTHYGELSDAIEREKGGTGETAYFAFKACKNGNLHLSFRRLDLLAKFNQYAGGMNLRPAA
jgi:hypothetical protein